MKLQELAKKQTFLEKHHWKPTLEIGAVVSDSRNVKRGDLFVACPGPKADGAFYIEEAARRGARVIVSEKTAMAGGAENIVYLRVADARKSLSNFLNEFYNHPSEKLRLTGVTGTNGKTTIAYLLNELLKERAASAYIGTLGVKAGATEEALGNTTPGAEELFSLLARMVKQGIQTVSMEVSSHALDQKRVAGIQYELALFTQLTPEHLDYHQSLENYFQAKRLLFAQSPKPKKMLINRDSPFGRRLLAENPEAKSFSLEEESDYRARDVTADFNGSEFTFQSPKGKSRFRTRLPMIHNVANTLSVLASLDLLGFDPTDFREALENFPGVPGRLERIEGNGFSVFVDYAHTPDAFEHILSEARRLQSKRILTLFGCGGDRDPYKRPEMTRIAYHYSDFVILTSDNPRTEDAQQILKEMKKGLPAGVPLPNVLEILDRREAIRELLLLAEPGDVLLILGKGHEDYQIIGTRKTHFDDREIVKEFLKKTRRARVAL